MAIGQRGCMPPHRGRWPAARRPGRRVGTELPCARRHPLRRPARAARLRPARPVLEHRLHRAGARAYGSRGADHGVPAPGPMARSDGASRRPPARRRPHVRRRTPGEGRRRGDRVHLRHDGKPQGCRAHAREHRRGRRRSRGRPRGRAASGSLDPAAVAHVRADGRALPAPLVRGNDSLPHEPAVTRDPAGAAAPPRGRDGSRAAGVDPSPRRHRARGAETGEAGTLAGRAPSGPVAAGQGTTSSLP